MRVRVIGFDSLVLARLGRNYLFTSAELKRLLHISYRDLQTILFLKLSTLWETIVCWNGESVFSDIFCSSCAN